MGEVRGGGGCPTKPGEIYEDLHRHSGKVGESQVLLVMPKRGFRAAGLNVGIKAAQI